MAKSISKKIITFLLIALCATAFAFATLTDSPVKASAAFENTFDDAKEYSEDEVNDRFDALKTDIAAAKETLGDKVTVDQDEEAYSYLVYMVETGIASADYNGVAESYLFGNVGLNGLYGIYESACDFYDRYVAVDEDGMNKVSVENNFTKSVNVTLVNDATEFFAKNFNAGQYETQDYDKTLVDANVEAFVTEALEEAQKENERQIKALQEKEAEVNYYRELYFGDKYGTAYANKTLYDSETDVSTQKMQEVIDKLENYFVTENTYEIAINKIEAEVATYKASLETLKTALERAYDEITANTEMTAEEKVEASEAAFEAYNQLGTIIYFVKADGNDVVYSLKDLRPVNADKTVFVGDRKVALNLLNVYRGWIDTAVADYASDELSKYGATGGSLISDYRRYAKGLADCLQECGVLPENEVTVNDYTAKRYEYNGKQVISGSDIIEAFKDSFTVDGALQIKDKGTSVTSESLEDKILQSSVTSKTDKDSKYEVTLTCTDAEGNPVPYFDSGAILRIREGATPSVERNINLLLKDGKKIEDEETRNALKGKIVRYYFTVTVLEPNKLGGEPAVKKIDADEGYNFVLTIKFLDEKELAEFKKSANVINYRHVAVEEVYKITWGEDNIMFNITDFTNEAQMAIVATGNPTLDNIVTYGVLGLGGLIVLLFLVWIIIAIVRNWKYKITFYARGGRFNSKMKVKVREKFNLPADPKRKGYKFLGWYADPKCTVKFAATELTKRKNIKVYAKWMTEEEYKKLEEQYATAGATAVGVPVVVDAKKDPQIEKIEAEKLSYEAKKAEEERKTEEVKLQAIREIEQAKKNEEALAKAEQDAKDAIGERDKAINEREDLIKEARADERTKCIEEIKAVSADDAEAYEAAIEKAKAETEERVRKEYDEKADEQARINAEYAARIKALEEANAKQEADAKAREAEEQERINAAIAAGIAARAAEEAEKQEKVEEPIAIKEEPIEEPIEEPEEIEEEVAEEIAEETEALDTATVFDKIKAEIYSYTDADDLGYSLEANIPACAMKVVGETIELEVNLDKADCEKKGYRVSDGEKLPVKFVIASEDDVDEAYELVEETMFVNGLKKTKKAVITEATEETRKNGFEYGISKDKIADTPEEFYKILRVYAQSFVFADDGEIEEKTLVKMFLARGKVYVFLNYQAEGLNACDEELAAEGYKTFFTVKTADDCRNAINTIGAMMKENGLIRYPAEVSIAGDDCKRGFTYTLSK